nr:snRNA-activating protein complex subunit 1-like isoform X1 [Rhipicephalus microplus]
MDRVKVLKKVSAGFQTDMDTLLRKFMAEESIRYSTFSKVWKAMKFSLVFCGRKDQELRLFFEEIAAIILQLWAPTCSFREKVFGLYMLYGVYASQPILPKLKIRLRLADWEQSEVVLRIATREQHLDICYILYRMRLEHCFHIVALLSQRSPVMYHGQGVEDARTIHAANTKVFAPMEAMSKQGTIQQLQLFHQNYMAVKAVQEEPVKDLMLVKEDIYDVARREVSVLQFEYRCQEIQAAASTSRKAKGSTIEEETVVARRGNLRAQQYSAVTNTRLGKRCAELMGDVPKRSGEDESAPESAESSSRHTSLGKTKLAATENSQESSFAGASKRGAFKGTRGRKSRESSSAGASKRGASKATRGRKKSGGKKPSSKKSRKAN